MWLQRFTHYLLRKRTQALALTFFVTFLPIVGILGVLIAAFMTLIRGVKEGALFIVAATLPYFISYFMTGQHEAVMPVVVLVALGVAVLSNVLTWVFAVMLYQRTSWSDILQRAALFGVLVISVIHMIYPNIVEWWGGQLQTYYTQTATLASSVKGTVSGISAMIPPISTEQLQAIQMTKHYATGLMTAAILLNALFQLALASTWQALLHHRGSLAKALKSLRLSRLAGVLLIISLGVDYWGNSVISDIMPILYLLFIAAGLSFIHYAFGLMTHKISAWIGLMMVYFSLILSFPWGGAIICLIAFADCWLDLRKKLNTV